VATTKNGSQHIMNAAASRYSDGIECPHGSQHSTNVPVMTASVRAAFRSRRCSTSCRARDRDGPAPRAPAGTRSAAAEGRSARVRSTQLERWWGGGVEAGVSRRSAALRGRQSGPSDVVSPPVVLPPSA